MSLLSLPSPFSSLHDFGHRLLQSWLRDDPILCKRLGQTSRTWRKYFLQTVSRISVNSYPHFWQVTLEEVPLCLSATFFAISDLNLWPKKSAFIDVSPLLFLKKISIDSEYLPHFSNLPVNLQKLTLHHHWRRELTLPQNSGRFCLSSLPSSVEKMKIYELETCRSNRILLSSLRAWGFVEIVSGESYRLRNPETNEFYLNCHRYRGEECRILFCQEISLRKGMFVNLQAISVPHLDTEQINLPSGLRELSVENLYLSADPLKRLPSSLRFLQSSHLQSRLSLLPPELLFLQVDIIYGSVQLPNKLLVLICGNSSKRNLFNKGSYEGNTPNLLVLSCKRIGGLRTFCVAQSAFLRYYENSVMHLGSASKHLEYFFCKNLICPQPILQELAKKLPNLRGCQWKRHVVETFDQAPTPEKAYSPGSYRDCDPRKTLWQTISSIFANEIIYLPLKSPPWKR